MKLLLTCSNSQSNMNYKNGTKPTYNLCIQSHKTYKTLQVHTHLR